MSEYWLLLVMLVPTLFVGWLFWDEERQLRKLYREFGTTGFWDVDARLEGPVEQPFYCQAGGCETQCVNCEGEQPTTTRQQR